VGGGEKKKEEASNSINFVRFTQGSKKQLQTPSMELSREGGWVSGIGGKGGRGHRAPDPTVKFVTSPDSRCKKFSGDRSAAVIANTISRPACF
jgi:hypothetical protein